MSINDLFKSKEDKEKDSLAYQKMIFPLGLEQRDLLKKVIESTFPDQVKKNVFYYYVVAKQFSIELDNDLDKNKMIGKTLSKVRPRLNPIQKEQFLSILSKDLELDVLVNYENFINNL